MTTNNKEENQSRGAPFKAVSLILALVGMISGLRCIFACDSVLFWEEYDMTHQILQRSFPNCRQDKYTEFAAGATGCFPILQGLVRIYIATSATPLSNMYHALLWLLISDTLILFLLVRLSWQNFAVFWQIFVVLCIAYEAYVALHARKAVLLNNNNRKKH